MYWLDTLILQQAPPVNNIKHKLNGVALIRHYASFTDIFMQRQKQEGHVALDCSPESWFLSFNKILRYNRVVIVWQLWSRVVLFTHMYIFWFCFYYFL